MLGGTDGERVQEGESKGWEVLGTVRPGMLGGTDGERVQKEESKGREVLGTETG